MANENDQTAKDSVANRPATSHLANRDVLAQRARAARFASLAKRFGYLCYALSMAVFFFGLASGFTVTVARIVVASMIAGSVLLAPAIIVGYAVKAAVRDDLEHGRPFS